MTDDDGFWDNLFLGCAFAAYIEQAQAQQGWPDSEATKRRAYCHYEQALAEKKRKPAPLSQRLDPDAGDDD